jgi:hypothetical protein
VHTQKPDDAPNWLGGFGRAHHFGHNRRNEASRPSVLISVSWLSSSATSSVTTKPAHGEQLALVAIFAVLSRFGRTTGARQLQTRSNGASLARNRMPSRKTDDRLEGEFQTVLNFYGDAMIILHALLSARGKNAT